MTLICSHTVIRNIVYIWKGLFKWFHILQLAIVCTIFFILLPYITSWLQFLLLPLLPVPPFPLLQIYSSSVSLQKEAGLHRISTEQGITSSNKTRPKVHMGGGWGNPVGVLLIFMTKWLTSSKLRREGFCVLFSFFSFTV